VCEGRMLGNRTYLGPLSRQISCPGRYGTACMRQRARPPVRLTTGERVEPMRCRSGHVGAGIAR
jgi:hypothetical protein